MVTELESALRRAVDAEPAGELDTARLLASARGRVVRRRVRRASVAAVTVAAVGAAVAVPMLHDGHTAPVITPSPTPTIPPTPPLTPEVEPTHSSDTSMTPREVVAAGDAALVLTGVSMDDPDFRVSVWEATCHWCPTESGARFKPSFRALVVTNDGYATAVYRRPPFDTGIEHVESVGPGLLLVVDRANGYEWLIRDDGTITPLDRDFDEVPAADPRWWFLCDDDLDREPDGTGPYGPQQTWCALDPKAGTVHIWEGPWTSTLDDSWSVVSPEDDAVPWGLRDPVSGPGRPRVDPSLTAWWESGGTRHYHDLSDADYRGAIGNAPAGLMSYWSWSPGSPTMQVFTSSDDGTSWTTTELGLRNRPASDGFHVFWTPGGDLLVRQNDAFYADGSIDEGDGLRILRAEFEQGGTFTTVYEARTGNVLHWRDLPFSTLDGQLWASDLRSDDDGHTWTQETTWRP